ncbi:hypothetical protein BDW02DRAFT_536696 [Decorospora gaudefroyi]|uniref:Tachykinin family protein n=1 Tax=Decorospora gaudefroyi TaxID=184978 RepID=A0A6A5JZP8_9PLEO|nr:hypothetical protein BDW02DRAFT_536696 [Decorospora gaudefroyi]
MGRSTKPRFSFVNLKHPDDLKDGETQLRIRRLAMAQVGKARRRPNTKRARNEIVLEFRAPPHNRVDFDRFGGGLLDPFCPYPVELDHSGRALLANIFTTENDSHPSQLRGSWYPVGLSDAGAFHNMLANSHNFLFQKRNGYFPLQDDALALKHHHKALRYTSELLKDPAQHLSDRALGAVVSFMIHHTFLANFSSGDWEKHRDALIKIVALRGGIDTITKAHLRITVNWADLIGSFFQDHAPLLPMPAPWLADSKSPPHSPRPFRPISLAWKRHLPMHTDWISIFDDIVHLISLDGAFNAEQKILAVTSGSWLEPTLYRLLVIRPLQHGTTPAHMMEEIARLGTLIFLAPFWKLSGQSPVCTVALSSTLLRVVLANNIVVEWEEELKPLLIWVLYCAAVETRDLAERREFVCILASLMRDLRLCAWNDLMLVVKSVVWVEKVFGGTDILMRDEP